MSDIKERPILFSAPMVQAILDGRKTMTRRVVNCLCNTAHGDRLLGEWPGSIPPRKWGGNEGDLWQYRGPKLNVGDWFEQYQTHVDDFATTNVSCPYGAVGDRLWVRETVKRAGAGACWYAADNSLVYGTDVLTRQRMPAHYRYKRDVLSSIHMPRDWSRITLEITGLRIERLHDITEDDAKAEGVLLKDDSAGAFQTYRQSFAWLWHKINGMDSWTADPWVWVVSFKRIKP